MGLAILSYNTMAGAGQCGPGENRADAKKAVMDFMQRGGINEFGEGSNQLNLKRMGLMSLPLILMCLPQKRPV